MTSYSSRFFQIMRLSVNPFRCLHTRVFLGNGPRILKRHSKIWKKIQSDKTTVVYFDPNIPTEVIVDASPVGLGAVLTQCDIVIFYSRRALTTVESRYSQTERGALAVVWVCEHLSPYIYWSPEFTLITDHKPLEKIWTKPKPSPRIERWELSSGQ